MRGFAWEMERYPARLGALACPDGGICLTDRGMYPALAGVSCPLGVAVAPLSFRIVMARIGAKLRFAWHVLRLADCASSPSHARAILSCPLGGADGETILS